jgi:hypothetical protein
MSIFQKGEIDYQLLQECSYTTLFKVAIKRSMDIDALWFPRVDSDEVSRPQQMQAYIYLWNALNTIQVYQKPFARSNTGQTSLHFVECTRGLLLICVMNGLLFPIPKNAVPNKLKAGACFPASLNKFYKALGLSETSPEIADAMIAKVGAFITNKENEMNDATNKHRRRFYDQKRVEVSSRLIG